MSGRKSQSALEFLTTYGWAFLIILIMVGALAYFGILNPSGLLPNRCNFGPEWECVDYQVTAGTSTVRLKIKNNMGKPVTINNIAIGTPSISSLYCTTVNPAVPITGIKGGEIRDITFTVCDLPIAGVYQGDKAKLNVTIDYYSVASGANYIQQTRGDFYTGVV